MKIIILILSLLHLFKVDVIASKPPPNLEKFTLHFDFENGSVGSWSSYPPAQDVAYDPTIWVKRIPEFTENHSLLREFTPNYDIEYIFGFRKKVDIYVNRSSSIGFQYYIKNRFGLKSIRVRLGFYDGTTVEKDISHNQQLSKDTYQIKFSEFIPDDDMKHLTGFAIMAVCPKADSEALMRFGIDDVKVVGMRSKNWTFESPGVHKLDEWKDFISSRHYSEGDVLNLSGKIPFKAKSAMVHLTRALTGESGSSFPMKFEPGNIYSISLPLKNAGFWRATLTATDASGYSISSSLVFLVKPQSAPDGHPRLFMSPGEEKKILDRAKSGHLQEVWNHIKTEAKRKREQFNPDNFNYNLDAYDDIYWLPTYHGYVQAIKTPAGLIRDNGVEYALNHNADAGEAARRTLLKMSQWPTYVHPHILNQGQFTYWPVGLVLTDMALGYDHIYNSLTETDRTKIATAFLQKGIIPVFKEYVRDNRVSSNTSNWISHVTGGGILSAVAIMNEYSDQQIEPYLSGMILKIGELINMTFDEDGSYGEGYSYHNFTMQTLCEIMAVLDRNFGIRFPAKVANSYKYLIYQMNPSTGKLLDFGDTNDKYFGATNGKFFPMSNFSYLIGKYRDPHLKWLYDLSPGKTDLELFFLDETVAAIKPENYPKVKHFRDVGTVVFRSGFETNDFIFVFRCGPFYNHQHFDQGSFFLSDLGEEFISESGKTDYYEDPWYKKLFIQPGGHNCILVDENPESQRAGDISNDVYAWQDYAKITDFIDVAAGAFVSGDLTKIYKGKFKTLTRNILFIKPRTIILIDKGVAANGAKEMNLRFHPPRKKNLAIEENTTMINRGQKTLYIHTIFPEKYTREILKRPLSLSEFGAENAITLTARGFLQLTADLKPDGNSFVNILTTDKKIISGLNIQHFNSHSQFEIDNCTYFVNTGNNDLYLTDEIKTDALIYSAQADGIIAFKVKKLFKGSKKFFTSSSPVSVEIKEKLKLTVKYSAPKGTQIQLYSEMKPKNVELNNELLTTWKYKNSFIELTIPKGNGELRVF